MIPVKKSVLVSDASSIHLDFVRGAAAIAVVMGHIRYLFFTRFDDLAIKSTVVKVFYFAGSLGHVAVVVFFVLSGFWISSGLLRGSVHDIRFDRYAVQRLSRLYVVLLPALLLGVILDGTGLSVSALRETYLSPLPQFGDWTPSGNFTFTNFFGSLFFLQGIRTSTFGSNSPLWSLSYEFWYYVLFPLNLWLLFSRRMSRRVIGLVLTITIGWFIQETLLKYYLIWLLGVLPVVIFRGGPFEKTNWTPSIAGVLIAGFVVAILGFRVLYYHLSEYSVDLLVGLATLGLVTVLARTNFRPPSTLWTKASRFIADFSFTTYLVHLPILVMIKAIVLPGRKVDPSLGTFAFGLAVFAVALGLSYLFSRITEVHTNSVRDYFNRKIAR